MANAVKWATGASRTTGISAVASIAAGANYLGSEITNSTNKDRWMTCELAWSSTLATAGKAIELYVIYAVDGSTYEDGDATPTDPAKGMVAAFFDDGVTGPHRQTVVSIPIMPFPFKLLLKSELDVAATSVTLLAYTHNEEVQ